MAPRLGNEHFSVEYPWSKMVRVRVKVKVRVRESWGRLSVRVLVSGGRGCEVVFALSYFHGTELENANFSAV